MKRIIVSVLAVSAISTIARAESLEEKKYWQGQMDYINEQLETASKACDVKFTFEFTDKAKLRSETEKTNHTPNGVCGNIVDEVASLCRAGADEKAAVKAKIKGFQCSFKAARTLDLAGGIVKYAGNNVEPNFSDWAKPWLMKHL